MNSIEEIISNFKKDELDYYQDGDELENSKKWKKKIQCSSNKTKNKTFLVKINKRLNIYLSINWKI